MSLLDVNKSLLNLHKIGDGNSDPQFCDFVESRYLDEQVQAIKTLADMVTQLNRVGEGNKNRSMIKRLVLGHIS
jgi:ferritin heavy chain